MSQYNTKIKWAYLPDDKKKQLLDWLKKYESATNPVYYYQKQPFKEKYLHQVRCNLTTTQFNHFKRLYPLVFIQIM